MRNRVVIHGVRSGAAFAPGRCSLFLERQNVTPELANVLSKLHYKKRLAEGVWAALCPVHAGASDDLGGDLEIVQCLHCGKIAMRCRAGCDPVKIARAAKIKACELEGAGEEAGKSPNGADGPDAQRIEMQCHS